MRKPMREKFRQFMIGRYGTDGLNQFLSMSSIVMLLVSLLTRVSLFTWLGAALLILCYYRSLSRNISKRTEENYRFYSLKDRFNNKFRSLKEQWANRKLLDVTDKCKLKNLNCSGNQLSSLSLKDLPQLNSLDCSYNPELSRLEFDEKMEISTLFIGHCNFQNLDFLDRLPLLLEFVCRNNQLKELELPESLWIKYLDCSNNQLTRLSISENWLLTRVDCHSNRLDKEALNQLFEMLGTASDYPHSKSYLSYYDNPGEYTCNQEMPVRNGWTIEEKDAQ